jgi:hypothetical protein
MEPDAELSVLLGLLPQTYVDQHLGELALRIPALYGLPRREAVLVGIG